MPNSNDRSFPRREFLRGAVGVVGASVLGIGAKPALASLLFQKGGPNLPPVSIAYWNGEVLKPAGSLPQGDPTLERVTVRMQGYSSGGDLLGIDAHTHVMGALGVQDVKFTAWTAPPQGCPSVRFGWPVDANGVLVSARMASGKGTADVPIVLATGSGPDAKLLEGQYVIAPGVIDWNAYEFHPNDSEVPLVCRSKVDPTVPFLYVVLSIVRA